MSHLSRCVVLFTACLCTGFVADVSAAEHPYFKRAKVRTVDIGQLTGAPSIAAPVVQPRFDELDALADLPRAADEGRPPAKVPDGFVQMGSQVVPESVAQGLAVEPETIFAVEDIPGNKYPRKATLFVNFDPGMLFSGADNSAENRSTLARQGVYPAFRGETATALATIQALEADLAGLGVRVLYDRRPSKTVPYTMAIIGGSWRDVNIGDPAGGVAPGADCGALGQRHVVYTFGDSGASRLASTTAQEAGHAWGLDHTVNCNSVMSYCGRGEQSFSNTCDALCEEGCQGPAGCRLTHEMFCGEGNDQQNEIATLQWLFGSDEPDIEPPTVEIRSPEDGLELEAGADVPFRAKVDDNYGGFGWRFIILQDGEVLYDEVDYDKAVNDNLEAALNLTNLIPGVYELSVEAEDQADQVTRSTVTVTVVEGSTIPEGGSGESGGDAEPQEEEEDEEPEPAPQPEADGTGGTGGDGAGVDDAEGGGCSIAPRGTSTWWLFLFLGWGLRRRRSKI